MLNKTIGIIGCGNMGSALIKGLAQSGQVDSQKILILDTHDTKMSKLSEKYKVVAKKRLEDLVKQSDYIIIAVKPNSVKDVLKNFNKDDIEGAVIISIAAGITIKAIEKDLPFKAKVARVMPNTPALVGEGMSAVCFNDEAQSSEREDIKKILECIGRVIEVDENHMNAVTALSGSGPAYVFMFIEAMADAGVKAGLKRSIAYELAAQTVLGSAKMVIETGKHPGELKDMVCSPAGTTIEAVYELEKKGFRGTVMKAIDKCFEKAEKMSEESGD